MIYDNATKGVFTSNPPQATLLCGGEHTRVDTSQITEKNIYIYVDIYKILPTRSIRLSFGAESPMGIA